METCKKSTIQMTEIIARDTSAIATNFLKEIFNTNNAIDFNTFYNQNKQFYSTQSRGQFSTIIYRKLATTFNIFIFKNIDSNILHVDDQTANLLGVRLKPSNTHFVKTKYRKSESEPIEKIKDNRITRILDQKRILKLHLVNNNNKPPLQINTSPSLTATPIPIPTIAISPVSLSPSAETYFDPLFLSQLLDFEFEEVQPTTSFPPDFDFDTLITSLTSSPKNNFDDVIIINSTEGSDSGGEEHNVESFLNICSTSC